jgi:hypothetical protein
VETRRENRYWMEGKERRCRMCYEERERQSSTCEEVTNSGKEISPPTYYKIMQICSQNDDEYDIDHVFSLKVREENLEIWIGKFFRVKPKTRI